MYLLDLFKLVPLNSVAEIGDKFTRNEILTANEVRALIGMAPSRESKADKLMNSNMPQPNEAASVNPSETDKRAE